MELHEALRVVRARGARMDLVVLAGIELADAVERVQKLAADNPPEWGRCCLSPTEILRALSGEGA